MGQSSGGALVLLAAASGVPMKKLASYEAPYVGQNRDHLPVLNQLIAEGNRKKAIGYFMVDMVGGPAFLPLMMRLMPTAWKKLRAVANTLPYDTEVLDGFEGVAAAIKNSKLVILPAQTHQVSTKVLAPELKAFFR